MKSLNIILTVILIIYFKGTQSCQSTVLDKVRKIWNNNPPTDILSKFEGTWTIYKVDMKEDTEGFKCWQAFVNVTASSSKDDVYFKNTEDDFSVDSKLTETAGVIEKKYTLDGFDYLDKFYVIYLQDRVLVWLLCDENQDALLGMSIKDYATRKDKPEMTTAVEEAEDVLKKAGFEIPSEIPTDCPNSTDMAS